MSDIPELDYVLNPGRRVRSAFQRNVRIIEISEELLENIISSTAKAGVRVWLEWPEPDADGFTTPVIHTELAEEAEAAA